MKKTIAFLALAAATIGSAAAQSGKTAGANTGGTTNGANGNNSVSSGNSSNTSSSAPNSNPTTTTPNYKPAATRPGTSAKPKGSSGLGKGAVVQSGGQGHNTTPEPKGKTVVAPSASNSSKKK
ncbi:MAG: hypothetical protein EOO36_05760 [Cytophagaceae bacterium]|nr:MAG: hypothetical protein EOO36_05760 [Cytophagaceae bacterium]